MFLSSFAQLCPLHETSPARGLLAKQDVLRNANRRNDRKLLVQRDNSGGIRHADVGEFHFGTVAQDGSRVRSINAGYDLYQGGLAGTVLAEKCMDFSGLYCKIDAAQSVNTIKVLENILCLDSKGSFGQGS